MIAIAREFSFPVSKKIQKSQKTKTVGEVKEELEGILNIWENEFGLANEATFQGFKKRSSLLVPKYMLIGMPIEMEAGRLRKPDEELKIRIDTEFPSSRTYPVIEYLVEQKRSCFLVDHESAYSLVVKAIRRGRLSDERDREFAYALISQMNNNGLLSGRRVMNPWDVNLAREVLGAAYYA